MKLALQRARIRHTFFTTGWLIPAWLPILELIGRSYGTIFFIVYLLWAALSVKKRDYNVFNLLGLLFLLLFTMGLFSALGAEDTGKALSGWRSFASHILIFPITLFAIGNQPENHDWERALRRAFGFALTVGAVLFVGRICQHAMEWGIGLKGILRAPNGMPLAYLIPFLWLYLTASLRPYLSLRRPKATNGGETARHDRPQGQGLQGQGLQGQGLKGGTRRLVGLYPAIALGLVLLGLFLNNSRTEMVVVVVVLTVWRALHNDALGRWLRRGVAVSMMLLTLGGVLVVGLVSTAVSSHRASEISGSTHQLLMRVDAFSRERTAMWRNVLANPPPNILTGVGMKQVRYQHQLFMDKKAKHLHNFVLDIYYENGLFGLAAIFLWLGLHLFVTGRRILGSDWAERQRLAPWVAVMVGILVGSLLDLYYISMAFATALFFIEAIIWKLVRTPDPFSENRFMAQ